MKMFWQRIPKPDPKIKSLHEAVKAGDIDATKAFLRAGADPNTQDANGVTPLHVAAAHGSVKLAKLLIENGGDVNFLIKEGGTPLMAASACHKPLLVELLLSKGANPNKKGHDDRFPLVCTFRADVTDAEEQLRCIRLLVKKGALINERTYIGITPLMNAAWFGNAEGVVELLWLGADSSLRDNTGKTAAILAFERGYENLAGMIRDAEMPNK
jgi:ankyrin repeat protein